MALWNSATAFEGDGEMNYKAGDSMPHRLNTKYRPVAAGGPRPPHFSAKDCLDPKCSF